MDLPSTINAAEWTKLPEAVIAPSYHVSTQEGSGCFMDPPGFPSYFIRHVYTKLGNTPSTGPESLLFGRVLTAAGDPYDATGRMIGYKAKLRRLYNAPAVDSERVQSWARNCAGYFAGGVLPSGVTPSRNVADLKFLKLGDIKLMLDNGALELERCRVADYILAHFPTFPRDVLYILCTTPGGYGKGGDGTWWERLETKPTPETCPGDGSLGRHPVNGKWCQVCGWEQAP